jgi:hypothetical protein
MCGSGSAIAKVPTHLISCFHPDRSHCDGHILPLGGAALDDLLLCYLPHHRRHRSDHGVCEAVTTSAYCGEGPLARVDVYLQDSNSVCEQCVGFEVRFGSWGWELS